MRAFNGDHHIAQKIRVLTRFHGIRSIVETGTNHGDTTEYLAPLAQQVISIDNDREKVEKQRRRLAYFTNLSILHGNSPDVLKRILTKPLRPVLFYLDAHWDDACPLIEELETIAAAGLKDSVIAIHDFQVPGTDFGFGKFNDQPYCLEWITPALKRIYGPTGFRHTYNTVASGIRHGIIYIEPAVG